MSSTIDQAPERTDVNEPDNYSLKTFTRTVKLKNTYTVTFEANVWHNGELYHNDKTNINELIWNGTDITDLLEDSPDLEQDLWDGIYPMMGWV